MARTVLSAQSPRSRSFSDKRLDQHQGARRAEGSTGDGNDFEWGLMGSVPVRIGDVPPSEKESLPWLNIHINHKLMIIFRSNYGRVGSELVGDSCPRNSGGLLLLGQHCAAHGVECK